MSSDTRFYSVIGAVGGRIQSFGRGMTLDAAQALSAKLTADGIGGARTSDTGTGSGIQNAQAVTNLAVVRESDTGEALQATATQEITVTAAASGSDGTFYFTPSSTAQELIALTVNGSAYPDVGAELLRNGKIAVYQPRLVTTDAVSAFYKYKTTADVESGSELVNVDGTTKIFELSKNYLKGTVAITAMPSALGAGDPYVIEGGGKLVEVGYITAAGASAALPAASGSPTIVYKYSSGEQAAVAASETHRAAADIAIKANNPGDPQYPPYE